MTIQEQVDWLVDNSTVLWIQRHDNEQIISGSKTEIDRFLRDQGNQISFADILEPHWQRKFDSFGNLWTEERQAYRFLYDSMKAFFISFEALRINKVASINSRDNMEEKVRYGDFAASNLMQMYVTGAKAIHLIDELGLTFDRAFSRLFVETRNKLFEHNYNPHTINDLVLEPSFWDVVATKSFLPVYIHTSNEREFEAIIDYYQDYYDLEKLFTELVENF